MPYRQRVPFTLATEAIPPIEMRADNTALIIQDMQYGLTSEEYGLGKVAAERGILVEFAPYYQQVEKVAENIARLKQKVTEAGMPVIYTRLVGDEGQYSVFQKATGFTFAPDSTEGQIISEIAPAPGDREVIKPGFGAFSGTNLADLLNELGIENLIVTGVVTEFGIRSTAATAQDLGFHPLVPSDGTASMTQATQSRTTGEICYGLTKVRSTGEVMTYIDEMIADDCKLI